MCFDKIFGMGPGLVSMSPHLKSSKCILCFLCVVLSFFCLWYLFFSCMGGGDSLLQCVWRLDVLCMCFGIYLVFLTL